MGRGRRGLVPGFTLPSHMSDVVVLLDGVAPSADARSLLDDPAFTGGMAVFETLRTYGRVPFRLDVHLDRLAASAQWCGIPCDRARLAAEIGALVLPWEAKINLFLSAGGRRVVRAEMLDRARVGAEVRVASREWTPSPWLPGRVKHTSRAAWVLAAQQAGVDEVLWVDRDGFWTEANRSNLFVVRDGAWWTPPDDGRILQGVTRDVFLEVARELGEEVHEAPVKAGPVEEIYLCSTLKELAPVVELDGEPAPGAGPVGRRIHAAFRRRYPPELRGP